MANVKQAPNMWGNAPDLHTQQLQLQRQQQMADMLRKQASDPINQQVVTGAGPSRVVPISNFQALAKMLQAGAGAYMQHRTNQQEKDMASRAQEARSNDLQSYSDLLNGRRAVAPETQEETPMPEMTPDPSIMGNPISNQSRPQNQGINPALLSQGVEEIKPDRRAALAVLLRSQDPQLQQFGMQQALAENKPTNNFNKVDPKDYTQDSITKFAQSGNYADLVALRKKENINGVWQDPYSQGENAFAPQDPNKPFGNGPNGAVPNTAFQEYELNKAKSGKTEVNVRTDVKMGDGLAAQVGPMMKDSASAAAGAVQQVDAAHRIMQAVDTNKMYAGPGASARLKIGQIGEMIGVSGKDDKEKIANTRQVIRGLAEMTLQGRKKMTGQGAVTESEGALAERAESGNIDDMTTSEIRQLAQASERASRFLHAEHGRKLDVMKSKKNLEDVAQFYDVPAMPPAYVQKTPEPPVQKTTPKPSGAKFLGFE